MPSLADLQSDFRRFILGDEAPGLGLADVAGDGLDKGARLSIYRNNAIISLTEALAATFPVVVKLVDRRFFDFAAAAFIRAHLPDSRCLSDYGAKLPAFLSAFAPAKELAYLPDVAKLEWLISRARIAEPLSSVPASALLAVAERDFDQIVFGIQPNIQHVSSYFPVDSIWVDNQPNALPSKIVLQGIPVFVEARVTDQSVALSRLDAATWEFRCSLSAGSRLANAVDSALDISTEFNLDEALTALFREGCVATIGV